MRWHRRVDRKMDHVSAAAPLAAIAAADQRGALDPAAVAPTIMPVPANIDLGLTASISGRRVTLTWRNANPLGGPVFYRLWRARSDGFTCPQMPGARLCTLALPEIGAPKIARYVDRAPRGHWVYRVAIAANWLNDPQYGDVYLVSRPVSVTVR